MKNKESNTVIEFPKSKVVREVPKEQIEAKKKRQELKIADTIVDEINGYILTELDNYDIDIQSKQFMKDYILVMDSLRAAVYRYFAIEHHLHEFIDNNITMIEENIEGLSQEEIKEKIETIMKELSEAKEKLDTEPKD